MRLVAFGTAPMPEYTDEAPGGNVDAVVVGVPMLPPAAGGTCGDHDSDAAPLGCGATEAAVPPKVAAGDAGVTPSGRSMPSIPYACVAGTMPDGCGGCEDDEKGA